MEDRIQMEGRILRILKANINDTGEYICMFEEKGQSYLYADHQGSRTWVTCKYFHIKARGVAIEKLWGSGAQTTSFAQNYFQENK